MTDQATGVQDQSSAAGSQQQVNSQQDQQSAQAQQQQTGQGQQTQQQGGQQQQQEPKKIEVTEDVLKTMRDQIKTSHSKVDELSRNLQQANDQLALYQAQSRFNAGSQQQQFPQTQQQNQQQMQGQQGGQQAAPNLFQGMNDADMPTIGEIKNAFGQMAQALSSAGANNPQVDSLVNTVRQLQVQIVDPNYQQTIQKYIPAMVNNNPIAYQMISRADNPMLAALELARSNPQYRADMQAAAGGNQQQTTQNGNGVQVVDPNAQQQSPDLLTQLDQLLNNQGKPGSPSSVSGAGAISAADKFAAMDDAAFDAHVQAIKDRGMG